MSKKATNENREHIDESDDESNIDWNGFGELVWKSYQERLKNGSPPEFQIRRTTEELKEFIHQRIMGEK